MHFLSIVDDAIFILDANDAEKWDEAKFYILNYCNNMPSKV